MDSFTLVTFLHLGARILLILVLAVVITALGEKMLGFNLKRAIDNVEFAADQYKDSNCTRGTVWPLVVLILGVLAAFDYLVG